MPPPKRRHRHSVKDQFSKYDFLGPLVDVVHSANPPQLVRSLQPLIDPFSLSHPADNLLHPIPAGLIDFRQMIVQSAGKEQSFEQARTMLFQVCLPHPTIPANGLPGSFSRGQIRKIIVPMEGVVDTVFCQLIGKK